MRGGKIDIGSSARSGIGCQQWLTTGARIIRAEIGSDLGRKDALLAADEGDYSAVGAETVGGRVRGRVRRRSGCLGRGSTIGECSGRIVAEGLARVDCASERKVQKL